MPSTTEAPRPMESEDVRLMLRAAQAPLGAMAVSIAEDVAGGSGGSTTFATHADVLNALAIAAAGQAGNLTALYDRAAGPRQEATFEASKTMAIVAALAHVLSCDSPAARALRGAYGSELGQTSCAFTNALIEAGGTLAAEVQ